MTIYKSYEIPWNPSHPLGGIRFAGMDWNGMDLYSSSISMFVKLKDLELMDFEITRHFWNLIFGGF